MEPGRYLQHAVGQPFTEEKQRLIINFGFAERDEAAQVIITPVPASAASNTKVASSNSAMGPAAAQTVIKRTLKRQDSNPERVGAAGNLMDEFDRMQDEQRHEMDTEELTPDGRQPQTMLQCCRQRSAPLRGRILPWEQSRRRCATRRRARPTRCITCFRSTAGDSTPWRRRSRRRRKRTKPSMSEFGHRITMDGKVRETENAENVKKHRRETQGVGVAQRRDQGHSEQHQPRR